MTLTPDDLESHIVVNVSSHLNKYHYLVCGCIVDVQMDRRTLLPGLLGHFSGDDLTKYVTQSTMQHEYKNTITQNKHN